MSQERVWPSNLPPTPGFRHQNCVAGLTQRRPALLLDALDARFSAGPTFVVHADLSYREPAL